MKKYTFLIEIGTEELPYKILRRLGRDFANQINGELQKNHIHCIEVYWFASARHLAVKLKIQIYNVNFLCVNNLQDRNIDNVLSHVDHVSNDQDKILVTENIAKIYKDVENITNNCSNIQDLLCNVVTVVLMRLKNYKMMKWGEIQVPFVRPVHTVTILLDAHLIRSCFFGINTDRVLYGHQFMKNNKIIIDHADNYPEILLEQGQVIVDYNKRKQIICAGIEEESKKIGGIVNFKNSDLLDEVTSLVEWPVVLSGKFDKKFLNLPHEIIHYIMEYDQKYFPVYSSINGVLMPYFIFVVNTITKNYEQIIIGYENVIKPRLMDAEFFFRKDGQYRLEDYISKLSSVLFHSKLGTLRDKSFRISILSGWIASKIGEDIQQAKRAGYLCKCDLMSSVVFEFPMTQGIIGMYYAYRDGELKKVALAQKEHYYPRFSTDILPTNSFSCTVAIADKIDTISGIFGIKEFPSGNRDPFALRRAAFGILRILIQKKLSLNLLELIEESVKLYGSQLINKTVIDDICIFMYKRLYSWYHGRHFKIDIIKSVLAIDYFNLLTVDMRMHAVHDFYFTNKKNIIKLYLIYKRIIGIIENKKIFVNKNFKDVLLELPEEVQLMNQIIIVEERMQYFLKQNVYYEILLLFITLFNPIDNFFDKIVIMHPNQVIQNNRLMLLNRIKILFLQVLDASFLHF